VAIWKERYGRPARDECLVTANFWGQVKCSRLVIERAFSESATFDLWPGPSSEVANDPTLNHLTCPPRTYYLICPLRTNLPCRARDDHSRQFLFEGHSII
jgi:hypothetical protein